MDICYKLCERELAKSFENPLAVTAWSTLGLLTTLSMQLKDMYDNELESSRVRLLFAVTSVDTT